MNKIECPYDLNQFLLGEPIFENPFPEEECKQRKFYGDCFHCFSTSICSRDKQLINSVLDEIRAEINSPNRGTCDYFIVDRIEEIINKYKESEDKGCYQKMFIEKDGDRK